MTGDQPRGPVEFRAGKVAGVDFPKRRIELVVVPYDELTMVEHRGRWIRESVAPGAFDGIERRPNRVRVNYHHQDHELRHQLGQAVSFHPSRTEGLVSVVRIKDTDEGDRALDLADDGTLGASGGFRVMEGGETWPDRHTRRLMRLWLDHIALTPIPAYEGAQVLSVRAQPVVTADMPVTPTPNIDAYRRRLEQERYAAIDVRWGILSAPPR